MPDLTPCPTCGSPLQDGAKFCGTCGTATTPNPVVPPPGDTPGAVEPADATPAAPPADEPTVAAEPPEAPTDPWAAGEDEGPEEEPPYVGPSAAPPPGGWGAPTPGVGPAIPPTAVGGAGVIGGAYGATTAQPATGGQGPQPTMAEQAVAAAGEDVPPGAYGGGPSGEGPGGGEGDVPHWMPDPAKEQESSRTGMLVVLGVAAGVLITLILLAIVLVVNSGDDDGDVSSDDTTTTTERETTTTTEASTTTTTEAETTTTTQASTTTSTTAPPAPPALAVGDCITNDPTADDFSLTGPGADPDVVPCSQGHLGELYYTEQVPDGDYPDRSDFSDICVGMPFQAYVGTPYQQSAVWATAVFPTEDEWDDGDRTLWCVAHENPATETTGSYRGSGR